MFIARGEHARAMRERGLRIESGTGNFALPTVLVATEAADIGAADLVVIAVKLWDTEGAARAVVPLVGPGTTVMSLQNGVEKDEVIAAIVGRERMIGGFSMKKGRSAWMSNSTLVWW